MGLQPHILKVISGGQTGVDRAALDAAHDTGVDCGGWCPAGRLDETGRIPEHYPMIELPQGGVRERTAANVRDSDGTIVISFGAPAGGTRETLERCFEMGRPNFLIAAKDIPPTKAVLLAAEFVKEHQVSVLNVAGPRASEAPEAYGYAYEFVRGLLAKLSRH